MPVNLLVTYFVALANILLATFVLIRSPRNWVNRSFFIFVGALSFWTISVGMLQHEKTLFWSDLSLFSGDLIGISFILFAKYFPEGKPVSFKFTFWFFILPATLFIILAPFRPFVSGIIVNGDEIQPVIGPLYPPLMMWLIFSPIFGCYILFRKFRQSLGLAKSQLKFVFIGFVIFLFCIVITNVILPSIGNGRLAFIGPVFTLILVGFASYAIIKHRFLDIKFIVARAVAYLSLILFIGLGYIAFLFNIAVLVNKDRPTDSTIQDLAFPTILALFFAISFQPLKSFFEKLTNRIFYKDSYDQQQLLWSLSRIMASTLNLSHLTQKIMEELLSEMKITYGSLVLIRDSSVIWVGSAGKTLGHPFRGSEIYHIIKESTRSTTGPEQLIIYEELPHDSKLRSIMAEHEITVVLPLTVKEELIGGILLGHKASGEIYSSQDIDVLKIVAPEIAVAVRNALSFDEIKKFNITLEDEIKAATQRLRNANHRLKELDNLKDEFVSIASHELRTPMTAIKSYLWMALNEPGQKVKEPLSKYLTVSYNSTERLIRLVNDMLTVSRIERNKIELKLEEVNVLDVLKQVHDELKVTAEERKIHFSITSKDKSSYLVNGDKEKLRAVFQNIIGNALKFTSADGYIKVEIEKIHDSIHTAISDSGTGIPKEHIKDLFKKFSKIDYSYAKHSNQPGTGLGLYISKQIVSLHGGDIQVESEVKVGTTFTVILPALKKGKEVKK